MLGADPEALGVRPDAPATVLAERELVPDDARAIRLFGPGGPPGARETFAARSDASVRGRSARRPRRRRRLAGVGAGRRAAARRAAAARGGGAARAAGRAAAGLPRRQGVRALLRGARGRVHPDHRRRRAPVLRLPRVPRAQARRRDRARAGPAGHAHADGHRLPDGRPALEVLRRRHGPALPGRAGHGRAPRLVRARVHRALLRGPRLPRPRQLHRELQPPARPVRRSRRARAGRR